MLRSSFLVRLIALSACLLSAPAIAEELAVPRLPEGISASHPLAEPWDLVSRQVLNIRSTVNDYTCRLIKRERIEGQLQQHRFIEVKVRREQVGDDAVRPFAVFVRYLAPKAVAGRSVLFVEGENDGRMLVRQTGSLLRNVHLRIATDSAAAKRESLLPITDLGFERMALALLDKLVEEMESDPTGENTRVQYIRQAKIDDRECTCIRVSHIKPHPRLSFHIAEVFVDEELNLPVRVASYDWPIAGGEPALISEFIYTRLKLNVGLSDADFSPERL